MTPTLNLHDLAAWIAIGDQHQMAEVYGIESPQPNHVTCWIASEPGKKFSVNWCNTTRALHLQAFVTIDGVRCNAHTMLDVESFPNRLNFAHISSARTSDYQQRDFMFAVIQVTDDDAYLETASTDPPFGNITLEIYPLQVFGVASQADYHLPSQVLEPRMVHARSNRAGTHQVCYGDEYISPAPIVDIVSSGILGNAPYAIFTFKYCPREMLIANGIIPPSPRKWKIVKDEKITQLEASTFARLAAPNSMNGHPYPVVRGSRGQKKGHEKESNSKQARKTKNALAEAIDDPTITNLN